MDHANLADEQAYGLIRDRRSELFAIEDEFTINPSETSLRQRILRGEAAEISDLDLVDCLEIAAENSRTYQDQKENLYRAALDLARERFNYSWIESGDGDARISGTGGEADSQSFGGGYSMARLLGSGATVVLDIGLSFLKLVGSGDGFDAVSDLGASVTQPLLRGFGRRIVTEPLTQAERNLVYEVRSFERFRRTFSVDVTSRVYGILLQMNAVENETTNIEALQELRERNEALSLAGRLSDIQVDQARQDELRSRTRLLDEQQRLQRALDDFKFFLGLPIDADLGLDLATLAGLVEQGVEDSTLTEEVTVETALARRLDYMTSLDRVVDNERRVVIAADALRAGLTLDASVGHTSPSGRPASASVDDVTWTLGLDLDLPVERLPERNAYRAQLISLQAQVRSAQEQADGIRADLRDALRLLATTRQSYDINKTEIALAERRVESAQLSLDAGRADTRDLLEAQEDLLSAQNSATRSLIDYALARLNLFRDMEILVVDSSGVAPDLSLLSSNSSPESTNP